MVTPMRRCLSRVCAPVTLAAAVLSMPSPGAAQTSATAGTAATSPEAQTPPPTQTKPPPSGQTPPPTQTKPPPPDPAAQPPAPDPAVEDTRSLFAPRWNMFQLSGRLSSVSGDPARWQRYQDIRDGLLFTEGRMLRETPDWNGTLGADNLGWRDQRYFGSYERVGFLKINGLWDEIPQFYSVDTRTAFTETADGVLVLDDTAQQAASHNAYLSISPQFDLRERRAIGTFRVSGTPTVNLDVTGGFTTTKHSGELPWGASFGFSNDNEVALPYRSRTNDLDVGLEWTNNRSMFRAAYNGSWFDNQAEPLVWDNPLALTDSAIDDGDSAPGHGRMALWPSNSWQTISAAGYTKFARRTQLTGSLALGWASNDEPLLPFTINTQLPQIPLPRDTADASATTVATTIGLVSRPEDDWRFSTRFRRYDYNNDLPDTPIQEFISYDTSVGESTTGGPLQHAYARNTFDADATWTGLGPVALTVAYTNNYNSYDFRIFESTNEHVLQLKADSASFGYVNFRARYEYGNRSGSGLDEASLIQIGEQPALRHYDVANRTRNRFVGQVDASPVEALTLSFSGGFGSDDFDDSYFGLQDAGFRNVTLSADYMTPNGFGVGGSYDYERYSGLSRSRSASPGTQANDPNRDWTVDSTERVHYYSIYATPPRIGANTEVRIAYEYAKARGNHFYEVGPALATPTFPSQLPETFNKLQDFRLDVRYRFSRQLVGMLSYVYEPSRIFDFAFDPSVIDSIVQPSSLVLGYTYRPYTTHTAVFGIRYYW
jgi:MtrB/PioB family decaheme-associated outer membrane protein